MKFKEGCIVRNTHSKKIYQIFDIYGDEYHYVKYPPKDGYLIRWEKEEWFEHYHELYSLPYNIIWNNLNGSS